MSEPCGIASFTPNTEPASVQGRLRGADADPISITLDGWISEIEGHGPVPGDPAALHARLVELYRRQGISFVERLHGSFTLIVNDAAERRVCLFADHISSRPLFWTVRDGTLLWASDLSGLLNMPGRTWPLSLPAVANFLSCGHHLGESTWLAEVHRLAPGQAVVWSPSAGVRRHTWFDYRPGIDADRRADLDELADEMAKAVLHGADRCLRIADAPVVTVSGGLDSRLVLGALLEMGASVVRTATWGRPDRYAHGDASVAARLAGTLGLEHQFFERHDDYLGLPEFTREFDAQTDAATYHIGELDILDRMLAAGWPACLYRGDECFGWLGEVSSAEEALGAVGIRRLNDLTLPLHGLFEPDALAGVLAAQISFFENLQIRSAQLNPVDLKDRIYFEHRLARYLNPSNDYKRSRAEVFNPLLDREVLQLLRRVPAQWRLYKRIEERLMQRRFPRLLTVPLASRASIPDATRRWREERPLREFMLNTLRRDGAVWSRLFQRDRLISFAAQESDASAPVGGKLKRMAGRLLRSAGLYEGYKRRTWNPLNHAQPSRIQLLQRLLAMRLWLDIHEDKLTLEI